MDRAVIEPYLNGFALGVLLVLGVGFVYFLIYIHDIPYDIAKKRNHPHAETIHVAGWVSLFLMHAIWPFLWVWAYWYNTDGSSKTVLQIEDARTAEVLRKEIDEIKKQLKNLQKE